MVGNPRVRSAYAPQPWSRRFLSLFLTLALALSLTPLPAWGDETGDALARGSAAEAPAESATPGEAAATEPQAIRETAEAQPSEGVSGETKAAEEAGVEGASSEASDQPSDSSGAAGSATAAPATTSSDTSPSTPLASSAASSNERGSSSEGPVAPATAATGTTEAMAVPAAAALAAAPEQDEAGVYQLRTTDDVLWFFASAPSSASAKLCNDFDMRGTSLAPKSSFSGTFDGDGHTLTVEIKLSSGDKKGLFASNSGTIENLTLAGSVTTVGSSYSGYSQAALVGNNTGTVRSCTNYASVTGTANYIGGLVAYNNGTVQACLNAGTVTTTTSYLGYAGGVAAYCLGGSKVKFIDCVNVGTITAKTGRNAGGIVGYAYSSSGQASLTGCQTTKTLYPIPTNSSVKYWLVGGNSYGMPTCSTTCSFYQVPVATLTLSGAPETGVTLQARALGETGMDASGTTFTWEGADSADGPFSAIANAGTGATFAIPQSEALVGKYLRASVTADGGSKATSNVLGPIVKSNRLLVTEAQAALSIDTTDITEENIETVGALELPSEGLNGAAITWASDNEAVIGADGSLQLPDAVSAVKVKLTATLRIGAETATKTFSVRVHPTANPAAVATISTANGSALPEPLLTGTTLAVTAQGDNGKTATDTTYQWQYAESPEAAAAGDWHDVANATKATFAIPNSYTTSNPEAWNGWVVRAVVQGVNGSRAETAATEAIAFSDYLSVQTDFRLLQAFYSAQPKDRYEACNLAFPTAGTHGTAIAWSSGNKELLSAEGVLSLPLTTTTTINFTGKVTKGSSSATYSGQVIAHPIPVELASARIEGTAESGQTLTTVAESATALKTPTNLKYQWQYSADGLTWSNANYATSATWKYSSYSDSYQYVRVVVTGEDELGQPKTVPSAAVPFKSLYSSKAGAVETTGNLNIGETISMVAKTSTYSWASTIEPQYIDWSWWVSESGETGSFAQIEGVDGPAFTIPVTFHESYLQVRLRTQGGPFEKTLGQVGPTDSAPEELAVEKARLLLQDAAANGWSLAPASPRDESLTALAQKKLSEAAQQSGIAIGDVSVRVQSAEPIVNGAFAGISTADDETNGDIEYFFYNPAVGMRERLTTPEGFGSSFRVSFVLRCGDATRIWTPAAPVFLGWDETRIQNEILKPCAQAVQTTMFAEGDSASAVTQNLNLPKDSGAVDGVLASPDDATAIFSPFVTARWSVTGFDSYYVSDEGVINERPFNDRDIALTGTFTFQAGDTTVVYPHTYRFTLKEDGWNPTLSDQEILQKKVDERYQLWNPTRSVALTAVGQTELVADDDFVLPTSTQLKLPGFGVDDKYTFEATSGDEELLSVNAYRVNVFKPRNGEAAATTLTIRVFERQRPWVCATKVFKITVPALGREEIEDEIALMETAKAQFFNGIANGQTADAVTGDLSSFEKVVWGENGALSWIRTHTEASATPGGLVWQLVTQGGIPDNNHYFQSSDEKVVTHENMLVTRPTYDKTVTVRACLSSERFADYYEQERYRNDPVWGPLLGQLYRQPLEATFTVKGTVGAVNPDAGDESASPVVSLSVTGITPVTADGSYNTVAWIPLSECELREGESAWDVLARALQKAGYRYSYYGGFLNSITTPDGSQMLGFEQVGDEYSYWHFRVNGTESNLGAASYFPTAGDRLELVYVPAAGTVTTPDIVVEPDAPGADWEADWDSFGTATDAPVAVDSVLGSLPSRWTYDFAQGGYASWSEPVVAGRYVFFATGARLAKLDAATGEVVAEAALADGTAYGCRPVYTKGLVVVPLNNGRLQALSALTLQTRWLTEALPAAVQEATSGSKGDSAAATYDQQGLSTLTVSGDYLYAFTAAADWSQTYEGWALCVNASTGAIRWMQQNAEAGYYWSGAAAVGDYLVVAGDDGVLRAVAAASADGEPAATLALGAPVRSTVVAADGFAYVVTTDGTLHKVLVGADGALAEVGSVRFSDYSTSTPTFADGSLYVGGSRDGQGLLAVIDAATLTVTATVATADGTALPGEVKSTPLLVRDSAGVVALFTCNGAGGAWPDYTSGGGVYAYRPGNTEAQLVYDPPEGLHNYAMGSVAYGGAGTFYYVNDSGHLFALGLSAQPLAPRPSDKPTNPEAPDNPTKPENPAKPGSGSSNGALNDSSSSATGAGNGQGNGSGAGSGIRPNGSAQNRMPFRTTLSLGSARAGSPTEASAAADATSAAETVETVADSPVPLADVSRAKASRTNADAGAAVSSEPDAASASQVPAATLALLSAAGLAAALYLILSARKRREEDADHA